MKLTCIRTHCFTGNVTEEIHTASVRIGTGWKAWVYLTPGVTGYESCRVEYVIKSAAEGDYWPACTGTPERWDKLVVPKEEMARLADSLQLFEPILEMVGVIAQRTLKQE